MSVEVFIPTITWLHSQMTQQFQFEEELQPIWLLLGVPRFVNWCEDNHLVLNVSKTEKMVFGPWGVGDHRPVVIHDQTIAQVLSYKYLGVFPDNSLTWSTHADSLCSRLHRRLRVHGVDQKFMFIFYQSVPESQSGTVSQLGWVPSLCTWKPNCSHWSILHSLNFSFLSSFFPSFACKCRFQMVSGHIQLISHWLRFERSEAN